MTEERTEVSVFTDGAARGNPGEGGAGVLIVDKQGNELTTICRYLGLVTNNVAEYQALLLGIREAKNLHARRIKLFLDSELVVKQLKGEYKVKNSNLLPLFELVKKALTQFDSFEVFHIPREENKRADKLANEAIDEHIG